jgi:GH15 family glucan-1,4-alpha-glucosidase
MANVTYPEYLQHLDTWLPSKGYQIFQDQRFDSLSVDRVFQEYRYSLYFNRRKTFCFVKYVDGDRLSPDEFKAYSTSCFQLVFDNKKDRLAGLFTVTMIIHPLIVTDTLSDEMFACAQEYQPRYFAHYELPAVFELSSEKLWYCSWTSFYGLIRHILLEREMKALFSV